MRGAPQVELSVTMRKMRSRSSLLTHFLPALARCRESHVQYNLKPARCQRMTVSGWTRISTCLHLGQSRRKITQNNLSEVANRGFGCLRSRSEASTVPTNDRLRLDEDQHLSPSRPEPSQDYPKQLVRSGKSRFWMPSFQDAELLPKRQVFQ